MASKPAPSVIKETLKKAPPPKTLSIPTSLSNTKDLLQEEAKTAEEKSETQSKEKEAKDQSTDFVTLTPELFQKLITGVKQKLEKEDKQLELAILNQDLEFHESEVRIQVVGHVQEEIAKKMIPSLVHFFREEGKVAKISFSLNIQEETEQSAQRMYTNSEKFEYLKQKHGALAEFQRKFGLDTDF